MKHRMLLCLIGCAVVFLASCARFNHQTSESETHGLVTIVEPSDFADEIGIVKRLDNLPVQAGHTYRVKPGEHQVVVQSVATGMETFKPVSLLGSSPAQKPATLDISNSGKAELSGQQPFGGMQMVEIRRESRRRVLTTNTLSVVPGWAYELEGERVSKRSIR